MMETPEMTQRREAARRAFAEERVRTLLLQAELARLEREAPETVGDRLAAQHQRLAASVSPLALCAEGLHEARQQRKARRR